MKKFKATFYEKPNKPISCIVSDDDDKYAFDRKNTFEIVAQVIGIPLNLKEELIKLEANFNAILDNLPFDQPFRIYNMIKELVCIIERVDEKYRFENILSEEIEREKLLISNKKKKFKFFFSPPNVKVMIVSDSGEPNTVSFDKAFDKMAELSGVADDPREKLDTVKRNLFIELDRLKINKGLRFVNKQNEIVVVIDRVEDDYTFSDMLDEEYDGL